MATALPTTTRELVSTLTADGDITLSIREQALRTLGPDDVLVEVGAAPINPSDLGLMFAGADLAEAQEGDGSVTGRIVAGLESMTPRFDRAMVCGNEGAGTVIATGGSDAAAALDGKVVGFISGDAYAEYRVLHHSQCLAMNDGTTPEQAAAWFVNPLTALGMTETMRREGHTGLIHTVGASNLGQMLNRICLADGIPLVNLVRRHEQAELLESQGAEHVVDSSSGSFESDLADALRATGATLAFDAIGGGELAGTILAVMERVGSEGQEYSRYGSDTRKQVYVYGRLDPSPIVLKQRFGLSWSVGGWLLTPFLASIGDEVQRLRQRVADEITTTFASEYGTRVSLDEAVTADHARAYAAMATGEKALVVPTS
ncbi:MAG: zinc-binding dehydrogenase [Actinomycetota bacterium]